MVDRIDDGGVTAVLRGVGHHPAQDVAAVRMGFHHQVRDVVIDDERMQLVGQAARRAGGPHVLVEIAIDDNVQILVRQPLAHRINHVVRPVIGGRIRLFARAVHECHPRIACHCGQRRQGQCHGHRAACHCPLLFQPHARLLLWF
jgi:hypothetical protein